MRKENIISSGLEIREIDREFDREFDMEFERE